MKRQLIHIAFLLFGSASILFSCQSDPNFSDTPQIEYLGLTPFRRLPASTGVGQGERDSVVISLNFRDGNGDLGDNSPTNKADSAIYNDRYKDGWGNYEIKTLKFVNGKYEELPTPVNQFLLFPYLTREGQTGAIEGTLDLRQIFFHSRSAQSTLVKFQIRIRDRNLNVSNTIETDTIQVPLLPR